MPARNGQQYISGLKERPPALYMRGERSERGRCRSGGWGRDSGGVG